MRVVGKKNTIWGEETEKEAGKKKQYTRGRNIRKRVEEKQMVKWKRMNERGNEKKEK